MEEMKGRLATTESGTVHKWAGCMRGGEATSAEGVMRESQFLKME